MHRTHHRWRLHAIATLAATTLIGAELRSQAPDARQSTFTPADFMRLRVPSGIALSPKGSHVAFVVDEQDPERDQLLTTVFTVPTRGGAPRRIARGRTPTWSPDGRQLAFLGRGVEANRLWRIDARGGIAKAVTRADVSISSFVWAPDSRRIAVIHEAGRGRGAGASSSRSLAVIDLADGILRDLSLGGLEPADLAWSPSGRSIAFSAREDIYVVPVSGGAPTPLVQREGLDVQPRWSPDGSRIAFASGQGRRRGVVRLSVVNASGCATSGCVPVDLGVGADGWIAYPPSFFAWSADGTALYVSGLRRMTQLLYALPLAGGEMQVVTPGPQAYWSFSIANDGRTLAFLASDSASAGDVVVTSLSRYAPRRLTTLNPWLATAGLRSPEVVRWRSRDGLEIEGLLLAPRDYRPGRTYPLLVQMEGTYGTYDLSFSGRVAADNNVPFPFQQQVFASAGYVVLMPNPRGSWGYGEAFSQRGRGDFGTGPLADILTGVEAMIARGIADSARLGIMGTGFDAYRALFALTQSDRFRAASIDGPLFDLVGLYEGMRPDTLFVIDLIGGSPAATPNEYARISPANFVDRLRTPTLISYADVADGPPRLQAKQGRLLEAALRRNGVPVEVIPYARTEGVAGWSPRALAALIARNLAWFQRWVPPG
jgi:dipeptidyl aminopeptidase/acylaminoacyl peptidase